MQIDDIHNMMSGKDKALQLARTALKDYCHITEQLALTAIDKALGGNKDEKTNKF